MNKTILTIAAHPDDEILGCGGAMSRFSNEGHTVHILIMAEGLTSRDVNRDRNSKLEELLVLSKTAKLAAKEVGSESVELLDFPDNRMDSVDRLDIVKVIEKKIHEVQPSVVFTHFGNDLNIDHRIANDATVIACRPYPGQIVKELYFFEVASSTEWQVGQNGFAFHPNYFIELSDKNLEKKINALKIYESEMKDFPHPRSIPAIEALARWRGATIGCNAAEAFMVGRKID